MFLLVGHGMIDIGLKIYYVDLMKNPSLYGQCRIACRATTALLSIITNMWFSTAGE